MRKQTKRLKQVRVVILEEGLELTSNILEAYFRFKIEIGWDVITLVNGDPCQGLYRENDDRTAEVPFFAKNMLIAEICANMDVFTFTQDHRTKNIELRKAKDAVRNAVVTPAIFGYLQTKTYLKGKTPVDIILCSLIKDMKLHNETLLAENPNRHQLYIAAASPTIREKKKILLNYKQHGVEHELILKKDAPVMIAYDVEVVTSRGEKVILRNGTAGKVVELLTNSIKINVPILGGIIAEVKRTLIYDTSWNQIPVVLAYAATIAKCIGFEFEKVAVDFGIQGRAESDIGMHCSAKWRQKMAYTAMSRAKQDVYFIGRLHISVFNNMDQFALGFFNSKVHLNQAKQKSATPVVRDIQELKEYWIQSSELASTKCKNDDVGDLPKSKTIEDIFDKTRKVVAHIDGTSVVIFAHKYPNVLQHMQGQGYLVIGTSNEYHNILLKVPCRRLEQENIEAEHKLLSSLNDVGGVLHLLARLHQYPTTFVLKGMPDRVPWKYFIKHATSDAKDTYRTQLRLVLEEIHKRRIVHGSISAKSVFTTMKGDVKLTWFQPNVSFSENAVL
jgi:hypothetical protein